MMKECKVCKNDYMEIEEQCFEGDFVVTIQKCDECGAKVKCWYDLCEAIPSNDAWCDKNGEALD